MDFMVAITDEDISHAGRFPLKGWPEYNIPLPIMRSEDFLTNPVFRSGAGAKIGSIDAILSCGRSCSCRAVRPQHAECVLRNGAPFGRTSIAAMGASVLCEAPDNAIGVFV